MADLPRGGGTFAISWGAWGGFYFRSDYATRICLGRLALTYIPRNLDFLMEALAERKEGKR